MLCAWQLEQRYCVVIVLAVKGNIHQLVVNGFFCLFYEVFEFYSYDGFPSFQVSQLPVNSKCVYNLLVTNWDFD